MTFAGGRRESQRALVAARIANIPQGGDRKSDDYQTANLQFDSVIRAEAADLLNVSERSVNAAKKVLDGGAPALVAAVEHGGIAVSAAAEIATLPKKDPPDEGRTGRYLIRGWESQVIRFSLHD